MGRITPACFSKLSRASSAPREHSPDLRGVAFPLLYWLWMTPMIGVMLGRWRHEYPRHDGPEHVLCFAPTRSGKGVGLVVPTLPTWPESAIVHDTKGENWSLTAGWRARFGRLLLFDPTNAASAAYNPLLEVRKPPNRMAATVINGGMLRTQMLRSSQESAVTACSRGCVCCCGTAIRSISALARSMFCGRLWQGPAPRHGRHSATLAQSGTALRTGRDPRRAFSRPARFCSSRRGVNAPDILMLSGFCPC